MKNKINLKLQNNDEIILKKNIEANKKNNILSFKYDNDSIEIKINKDNIVMKKENNESILSFNFIKNKKTESKYFIKELNFYIDTDILTKEISIKDNKIYIEYDLWFQDEYSGDFKYEIDIMEV